jgi:hypothetical protein
MNAFEKREGPLIVVERIGGWIKINLEHYLAYLLGLVSNTVLQARQDTHGSPAPPHGSTTYSAYDTTGRWNIEIFAQSENFLLTTGHLLR